MLPWGLASGPVGGRTCIFAWYVFGDCKVYVGVVSGAAHSCGEARELWGRELAV
jgi:hypothetical protein